MDSTRYINRLAEKDVEFEAVCKRCGECCGSLDDPCSSLLKMPDGKYFCKDYDTRFGPKHTRSKKTFNCVSIREHIANNTLRGGCEYRRFLNEYRYTPLDS